MNEPIPGNVLFESLRDKDAIILASNVRITGGVAEGIFRAAKDLDSAVIFEIARSECNIKRGYTGMVPCEYAEAIIGAAEEVGFDVWALHAARALRDRAKIYSRAIIGQRLINARTRGLKEVLNLNI